MKTILLILATFVASFASGSGNDPITAEPKVKEVTVFLRGAEVSSTTTTSVKPGQTEIVLKGLSPVINPHSLQVKGEGELIILGVSYQVNHLSQQPKPKNILTLEDSLEILQERISVIEARKSVLNQEEQLLLSNKNIGGQHTGVNSSELEKIAILFRTRLTDIKLKLIELQKQEKEISEVKIRISQQLAEENSKRNRNTGEVVVLVQSKTGGFGRLTTSYLVNDAGWSPLYDLRSEKINQPVELTYRANVFQNTGEDWENVKFTLSTGNPVQNATKPVLYPWWLSFHEYYNTLSRAKSAAPAMERNESSSLSDSYKQKVDLPEAETIADYTTVKESQTQIEYKVSLPYSINSGGKPRLIEIQKYDLPASFTYYAAPKIDPDAFLLARISGWEKFNLLPGEANIYFDGTYIGKSFINTNSTVDTLDVSLGRDKSVTVTRTLLTDKSGKRDFGGGRKASFAYEISVRNKKSSSIDIVIEDQVPLSRHTDLQVETDELGSAVLNEDTGLLTWKFGASPGETKKMRFGFTVKYPKDKEVNGL